MKIGTTDVECLIDTGAGPSCISESLMQCNPFFRSLKIKKVDKKAYSVSGAPVITLGIVEVEFKLGGNLSFTHEFTILRGLIHHALLGMDFLTKYNANINLGIIPTISLRHPVFKRVHIQFAKPPQKVEAPNYIAILSEIEIPPLSIHYADAYITDFQDAGDSNPAKLNRMLGIAAIQKTEESFDPGVLMRDAIIDASKAKFKVELMNPSSFPLKLEAETPVGTIFDYDAEILETGKEYENLWEEPAKSDSESFIRQQTLLISSIQVEEGSTPSADPATKKDPNCWPQNRPPAQAADRSCKEQGVNATKEHPEVKKDPKEWPQNRPPSSNGHFTKVFEDEQPTPLKFIHEIPKGVETSKEERDFMVDLEETDANEDQKKILEATLRKHSGAFAKSVRDIGCTGLIYHHVKISDAQPTYRSYHKAQGTEVRKAIEDQTASFLADGVIKESESPYCSPIVMVRKKCGGWRYCVDLRKINEKTEKVSFPVPKIEDALRRLKSPTVFSTMDLLKAYYQIPVVEEDTKYYAFSDGRRHLEFARCPMGAKNSGSTLALLMELVLRGLPPECVLGYLDDILIATEDFESHIKILDRLFTALEKAGLKLCPGKCHFAKNEVKTLGYRLSKDGIRPDEFNLNKIREWITAKDKKEVRTFLGLTGYYRTHVKGYAHIAAPLSDLTKNETPWKWETKQQKAFDELRDRLLEEPIAAYPDYEKEFILKTDASKVAMGAVLTQKDDEGKERMIACSSKKFGEDELKWIPYDREYWALVHSVRHFSHYLRFQKFTLITDHKPLLAWRDITTQRDGTNKRVRWAMELSTYEMDLVFKQGRKHADADALSRHPHPDEPVPQEDDEHIISSLRSGEEVEICFVAAAFQSEIPLLEINMDEAVMDEMRELQQKDKNISRVLQLIDDQNKDVTAWKGLPNWFIQNRYSFAISDGILYHTKKVREVQEPIARTVIPEVKQLEMLYRCHGHMQSGHPGARRAQARLEKFASWPNMSKDILEHVKSCVECQACRDHVPKKVALIMPQEAKAPLEFVQADLYFVGKSFNKKDYVLVIEDRFTKHCKLYAINDTKAVSVTQCVENYVTQMGCPEHWGTDGGPEFYDRLVVAMCSIFNTKKEFALAYRPQTQGQTERKNRTIKAELRKRIHQFGANWPSMLKWMEFSYNTTPHPSHGYSPFTLMFGREPRLPIEQDIPNINTKGWSTSMKTYFKDFLDRIVVMRADTAERKRQYAAKMAKDHDKNVLEPILPTTQVLRSIPPKLVGKTDMPKDGPWEVVEHRKKEGKTLPVYVVKDNQGNTLVTHRESLTPFQEPMIPNEPTEVADGAKQPKKEAKAKKTPQNEGPMTRSRSKRYAILSTIAGEQEKAEVPNHDGPRSGGANPIQGDDDDADDGGDGDDEGNAEGEAGHRVIPHATVCNRGPDTAGSDVSSDADDCGAGAPATPPDELDEEGEAQARMVQVGVDANQYPQMPSSRESSPEFHETVERPQDLSYYVIGPDGEEEIDEFHDPEERRIEDTMNRLEEEEEIDPIPVQHLFQEPSEESAATSFQTAESSPQTTLFREIFGGDVVPRATITDYRSSGSMVADLTVVSMSSGDDVFSPPLRTGASTNPARSAPPNTPQSRTQAKGSDLMNFDSITYVDENDPLFREGSEDRDEGGVTEVTAHVSGELIAKRRTSRERRPPDRWGK